MQFFDNVKFGLSRPVAGQPVQKTNHGDAVAQMRRFNSADFDRVFFGFGRLAEIFQRTLGNFAFGKQLAKKYGVVSASKPTVLFLYVFKALGSLASGSTPKSAGSKSKFRLSPNRVMRPSLSNSA